jgi:hypothetical protein
MFSWTLAANTYRSLYDLWCCSSGKEQGFESDDQMGLDTTSKVIDVEFLDTRMEDQCKFKVRDELLKMEGWKAVESKKILLL